MNTAKTVKFIMMAAVGFAIGCLIAQATGSEAGAVPIMGVLCMGVPFGWTFYDKYIGVHLIGTGTLVFIFWIFKIAFSFFVGWIIFLIQLVRVIFGLIKGIVQRSSSRTAA